MFTVQNFTFRFKYILIGLLFIAIFNLYFLFTLSHDSSKGLKSQDGRSVVDISNGQDTGIEENTHNTTFLASKVIYSALKDVDTFFNSFKFSSEYHHNFTNLLFPSSEALRDNLWETAANWVTGEQIIPKETSFLPQVLKALETSKILVADITHKGSQLKILLTLEGGQKALFKPKWYERDQIITGKVYAGKDRHNGEIAAFHLSRLLGLNRAPIVSGRLVNLKDEILPVATLFLNRTFYKNGMDTCFYGVCLYCKRSDGVCAEGNIMEGSVTLWLPPSWKLLKIRHPWQRSYSSSPATWELYSDYCEVIQKSTVYSNPSRLLDLIETAIFDFLIGNGDRHHYEVFNKKNNKVLLIDNGKSFGNPNVDFIDSLAPLYQCCREEFVSTLVALKNGLLSHWMELLLAPSSLSPVLTKAHLQAMNRRLHIVLATIISCIHEKSLSEVIIVNS